MTEKRETCKVDNVIENKTKMYLLAQKLRYLALELDKFSEDEKKIVIERADQKAGQALKSLYDSLNDYMEW